MIRLSSFMVWRFFLIVIPCFMNPFSFNWWTVWNGKFSSPPMIPHPRPALVEYQSLRTPTVIWLRHSVRPRNAASSGVLKTAVVKVGLEPNILKKPRKNKEKPRKIPRKKQKQTPKKSWKRRDNWGKNSHDFLLWMGRFKQQSNQKKEDVKKQSLDIQTPPEVWYLGP